MNICCVCLSKKHSKKYRIAGAYTLLKCANCGIVYLEDSANPQKFIADARENLDLQDKKIEYWSFPDLYAKHASVFERYFRERFLRLSKYKPSIKTMFDIGTGYGFWMDYCRKQGLKVKGIDVSEEAVDYGRSALNLDIKLSGLMDYKFDEQYDVYNLCDVLEHLVDPNNELRKLHDNMRDDSLLYLQVPDVLGFRIPYKHNLGLPHHIWQFNFKTLKRLLEKNGFIALKKWHGPMGIIGNYERNEVNPLIRLKWFLARRLNLGNRLMVLCKKK